MSEKKIYIPFQSTSKAHEFAQKVRKLPGVSYATDYAFRGNYKVMICGEWDDETEKKLKNKQI